MEATNSGGKEPAKSEPAPGDQELQPIVLEPLKRPDYAHMTESVKKRYRAAFKQEFAVVASPCPGLIKFPEVTNESDLEELHAAYEAGWKISREIGPMGTLRFFLVIGFMVFEFVGCQVFKLASFDGFTKREVHRMNKYDPILIEIGKKYSSAVGGGGWSPEYRLIILTVVTTVCYVASGLVDKFLGHGAGESLKDVILNAGDGLVSMVMPGSSVEAAPAEIVPNTGEHNLLGGAFSALMGIFGGGNKAKSEEESGRPRRRIAIKR